MGDGRRLAFIDSLHGGHVPPLRFQSGQCLAQRRQIWMPETFPFQRNRPGELMLMQQLDDLSQWQLLGAAPVTVDQVPTWGYYRVRAVKEGFAPTDLVFGGFFDGDSVVRLTLRPEKDVPPAFM